jgi:hypothetical protein
MNDLCCETNGGRAPATGTLEHPPVFATHAAACRKMVESLRPTQMVMQTDGGPRNHGDEASSMESPDQPYLLPNDPMNLSTKRGYQFSEVSSAMQKAILRALPQP